MMNSYQIIAQPRSCEYMNTPIKKIIVVGRDADAWLTALTLQLSFAANENKPEVVLVELPSHLRAVDFFSVLPSHQIFHKVLGANENALLRSSLGLYSVAQRFANWSGAAPAFLHAYDTHGLSLKNIDFFQYWVKARAKGLNVPLEDFSLGAVAAKQGRFVLLDEDSRTFSNASHGLNFNAVPYIKAIAAVALSAGLQHKFGEIKSVEHSAGLISSIVLQDDSVIEGDLFIDASGAEASLISQLEDANTLDWTRWFPGDRLLVGSAQKLDPTPAFAQISAFKEGWVGFFPMMTRTGVSAIYSSEYTQGSQVIQNIAGFSGMKVTSAIESPFVVTSRRKHWVGNCIAVGSSAVNFEPLDAVQLHVLHLGLSLFRTLFPVDKNKMPEAAIFNETMYAHAENIRDFQIAHYHLNKRFDDPFWDKARNQKPPASLARKINLFQSRGLIPMSEHETFQEENWRYIFTGHGLMPKYYDPLVDSTEEAEQIAHFQRILKFIAGEVTKLPSLQAHLEMNF